jgi:hypothetical protein
MAGLGDERHEEVLDFIAGQRDQAVRSLLLSTFVSGGRGEEGVGEHRERDPSDAMTSTA